MAWVKSLRSRLAQRDPEPPQRSQPPQPQPQPQPQQPPPSAPLNRALPTLAAVGPLPFPPPPPLELHEKWAEYGPSIRRRQHVNFNDDDTPTRALYRLYEYIVLGMDIGYRNELETFWYRGSKWLVHDIPDPEDPDPARYASLAAISRLIAVSFNDRIDQGLPRDAPPVFDRDELDKWREQDRAREEAPEWANNVPALEETIELPFWNYRQNAHEPLNEKTEECKEFAKFNIRLRAPAIFFV